MSINNFGPPSIKAWWSYNLDPQHVNTPEELKELSILNLGELQWYVYAEDYRLSVLKTRYFISDMSAYHIHSYMQLEADEIEEIERRHAQENLDRGQVDMPGGWPIPS